MLRDICFNERSQALRPVRAVGPAGLAVGLLLALVSSAAGGEARTYRVDPELSRIDVKVGTAGLFRFAGHDHVVRVKVAKGEILGDVRELSACAVSLDFTMADVRVASTAGSADDLPKIQEKMAGPAVLHVSRFPEARFRSTRVSGKSLGPGRYELDLTGDLTVHGVTRPIVSRFLVEMKGQRLLARGSASFKQTDFGIQPVSVAGVVKVKNELSLDFEIVALTNAAE